MEKKNDKGPNELVISSRRLVAYAIDKSPNPKHEGCQSENNEEYKQQTKVFQDLSPFKCGPRAALQNRPARPAKQRSDRTDAAVLATPDIARSKQVLKVIRARRLSTFQLWSRSSSVKTPVDSYRHLGAVSGIAGPWRGSRSPASYTIGGSCSGCYPRITSRSPRRHKHALGTDLQSSGARQPTVQPARESDPVRS